MRPIDLLERAQVAAPAALDQRRIAARRAAPVPRAADGWTVTLDGAIGMALPATLLRCLGASAARRAWSSAAPRILLRDCRRPGSLRRAAARVSAAGCRRSRPSCPPAAITRWQGTAGRTASRMMLPTARARPRAAGGRRDVAVGGDTPGRNPPHRGEDRARNGVELIETRFQNANSAKLAEPRTRTTASDSEPQRSARTGEPQNLGVDPEPRIRKQASSQSRPEAAAVG